MPARQILSAEAADARCRQQQRIFDSRPNSLQPFAKEAPQEMLFLFVRRRQQQAANQGIDILAIEWSGDPGIVGDRQDGRIEAAPKDARLSTRRKGNVDDRGSAGKRQLHDLAGTAATARWKAIPDGNQHVAMGDRRSTRHDVGIERFGGITRKLEEARRVIEQGVELSARFGASEAGAIMGPLEWQDRLQLPAEVERDVGRDLVSAISHRGNETKPRRQLCERVAAPFAYHEARPLDLLQDLADSIAKQGHVVLRECVGSMAGDAYGKDERDTGRPEIALRPSVPGFKCRGRSVQSYSPALLNC
jgi:hypothetical protein